MVFDVNKKFDINENMYKDVLIEVQELIEKRLKEIADNFEWTKIITKKKG